MIRSISREVDDNKTLRLRKSLNFPVVKMCQKYSLLVRSENFDCDNFDMINSSVNKKSKNFIAFLDKIL